jgi:peptide deformylase
MTPFKIVKYGDPRLRVVCKNITHDFNSSPHLQEIAKRMLLTMYDEPGVGLAATQVGLDFRLVVMDDGEGPRIIINPHIIHRSEETDIEEEGCLSVPDIRAKVERSIKIKYKAELIIFNGEPEGSKDDIREANGFKARILQHEIDHLDAVLFVDRIKPIWKMKIKKSLAQLKKETIKELKQSGEK